MTQQPEPVEAAGAKTGADAGVVAAYPPVEATGEPAVDAALARLEGLEHLAPADHVTRYDQVQQRLHELLTTAVDSAGADTAVGGSNAATSPGVGLVGRHPDDGA